jgi:hypothetical protein
MPVVAGERKVSSRGKSAVTVLVLPRRFVPAQDRYATRQRRLATPYNTRKCPRYILSSEAGYPDVFTWFSSIHLNVYRFKIGYDRFL